MVVKGSERTKQVTGSMGSVPRVLQTKLGALMRVLIEKGYVAHLQLLFGAGGVASCWPTPRLRPEAMKSPPECSWAVENRSAPAHIGRRAGALSFSLRS
ncbi:MAG TPA: hypothetical protein VLA19_10695 [Herpetosiphonaceae bacterium]|nr:hypothetical protein [Herpetosiphonaceae bacterium]